MLFERFLYECISFFYVSCIEVTRKKENAYDLPPFSLMFKDFKMRFMASLHSNACGRY